ncbi:MAG TPA: hypothetical protein VMY37_07165 [Thermoguttaceae bacterium]|nr:hypothetical protein [Thermoguttaceae bacterium]
MRGRPEGVGVFKGQKGDLGVGPHGGAYRQRRPAGVGGRLLAEEELRAAGVSLVEEGKGVVSEAPGDRFLRACSLSPAGRWRLCRARAESGEGFVAGLPEQRARLGAACDRPRFHAVGAIC